MRIGIDCDDVCSDFQKRFVAHLNSLYGRPPLGTAPIDWDWSNCQVSKEEMGRAWKESEKIENLWLNLEPLPSFDEETIALLLSIVMRHDVYFVTNRYETPGMSAMKQTKAWFYHHASMDSPNVVLAKEKGPMATVLQLDAFIDDRPKNCLDVLAARPQCHVFLADSSHNQPFKDERIPRVKDLKTFLKIILLEVF